MSVCASFQRSRDFLGSGQCIAEDCIARMGGIRRISYKGGSHDYPHVKLLLR